MAETARLIDANEASEAPEEILTVPRTEAQKYEEYDRWYANEDGLFTALGKFVGALASAVGLSRIDLAGASAKVRSSVENLRNPIHRVVEFYATTMLSGPLEKAMPLKIEVEDDEGGEEDPAGEEDGGSESGEAREEESGGGRAEALKKAILLHWEWSSMGQKKQVAKRFLAKHGQVFDKLVRPEGKEKVYQQFVRAAYVTDYETAEESDAIVYIRLDVPKVRVDESGRSRKVWATEIWRKGKTNADGEAEPGYALFAETERATEASVPTEKRVRKAPGAKTVELGSEKGYRFDFVPFVVVNAADTGDKRPKPVYAHGLHLIAWVCREATRLSDLMFRFNKAFKVIFGAGNDAQDRPIPAPRPGHVRDLDAVNREQQDQASGAHTVPFGGSRAAVLSREHEDISIEGIAVTGLPGTAQMADATPNINYEAARQWISDHMREVYEELPELLYYAIESRANQSGDALRTLIAGALSRAEEMQANLITGIVKADKMALTIAQLEGFEGFSAEEIGTYEDGGFDHEIEAPEILPLTEEEKQRAEKGKLDNAASLVSLMTQLGVPRDKQREVVLAELGHEDLIEGATDAPSAEPEGDPAPEELAASQQALAARLRGQQTPTGGDGGGTA